MGAAGGQALTRADVEAWGTGHLESAAAHWSSTAREWEGHFETIHHGMLRPGGTAWEGAGADAAAESSWGDLVKVRGAADGLYAAAGHATAGAGDVAWAKRQVLNAIAEAEEDGFTVGQDFSVKDSRMPSLLLDAEDRQSKATEHANDIAAAVQQLAAADKQAGERITGALAPLAQLSFPEHGGKSPEPTVQLVDRHFKLNPQDGDDPWAPNPNYPGRTKNGKYGPGNSGDGDAAAKAALDKRQEDTGIPLIRQEVRATHPDVRHPDGTPQLRYYDALEPTGNPDEYIGIEAKTNPGALRKDQQTFDAQVSRDRPATATLNGRPITIVGAEVEYPPEGWKPPAAQMSPGAGASAGDANAGPAPVGAGGWGGVHAEGTLPVSAAPTTGSAPATSAPMIPDWGTHLTPQQMIDSDDPFLRVAGQEIRRQMQANGQVDPSGTA